MPLKKNQWIKKSLLSKSDTQLNYEEASVTNVVLNPNATRNVLNHEETNVKNVVLNTNATRIVQPMAWNATTVGERTIFPVCRSCSLTMQHCKVHSVAHNGCDPSDDLFIGMVQCTTTNTPDWKVSILVNHQRTSFKIDTGAQCNVIFKSRYHQLSSLPL